MALIILIDKITQALENGDYVIGIFLDFSKAFDTIDHHILLKKLEMCGIRGVAHKWIQSYMSNRYQYVQYNDVSSSWKKIVCGVPQGSILGPLLFLMYINDLASITKHIFPLMFADDTNGFVIGKDLYNMQQEINKELHVISEWLKTNKLSLNVDKTHFMVFSGKKKISYAISIMIDGKHIERVAHTKFLGVIIDENLTWKLHICSVKKKNG